MFEEAKKSNPRIRFGTVQDVSNTVYYFDNPLASNVSGVSFFVDGAQHLNSYKMGLRNVLKSFVDYGSVDFLI